MVVALAMVAFTAYSWTSNSSLLKEVEALIKSSTTMVMDCPPGTINIGEECIDADAASNCITVATALNDHSPRPQGRCPEPCNRYASQICVYDAKAQNPCMTIRCVQ